MKNVVSKVFAPSMKTGAIIGMTFALAGTAHAGSISYDFRADYNALTYSADAIPSSSRFILKTGRIDFKGNLNESLTYQARWAMNKAAATGATTNSNANNQSRDALNSSVELAYITHKIADCFALSVGKFNTEIGGFEGATSGADLYLVSPMYAHSAVVGTTAAGTLTGRNFSTNGSPNLLYMTGVKGTIMPAEGQNLALIATNNVTDPVDVAPGGNFNQNRGLLGATYKGSFFEKALTGLVSYHEVTTQSPSNPTTNLGKHSFISAGIKWDSLPWATMLEYHTTDFKDQATGGKDTLNVVVARLAYNIEQWTPRLEGFTGEEKREVGTAETNRFVGVGAILEYKPTEDNFRYHIAYNTITGKPATGNEVTRNEIVVGARLLGDFLK